MQYFSTVFLIWGLTIIQPASPAKILGLFGFSGQSHNHVFSALTTELSRRGHDLTIVTTFLHKNAPPPPAKYRQIHVPAVQKTLQEMDTFSFNKQNMFVNIWTFWKMSSSICSDILNTVEVKELLNEKFDLVILSMFMNECCLPFANHFKAPLIVISPAGSFGYTSIAMGNTEPYSYVPSLFFPFSDHMNFWERMVNALIQTFFHIYRCLLFIPMQDSIAREFFGESTPSIAELERNTSLVFLNNHVSTNYPRPLLPSIIEVGGMHIKPTSEPLPKDLQEYLDGAKEGFIYFSMGSAIRGDRLPPEKLQAFLEAFKELPLRVLWKWESDSLPGQPSNVKLGKWLPQQAILAHPMIRVFVTHGGLLSTQEAMYHGIPLVGIPVFGDQMLNMKRSENQGFALTVDFATLSKDNLLSAIKRVLNDSMFRKTAKFNSRTVRDQLGTPLDRAVFWTEYVLRHGGAPHLRSAVLDLAWYQYFMLDVAAVLLFILVLAYYVLKCALKTVYNACCVDKKKSKPD